MYLYLLDILVINKEEVFIINDAYILYFINGIWKQNETNYYNACTRLPK